MMRSIKRLMNKVMIGSKFIQLHEDGMKTGLSTSGVTLCDIRNRSAESDEEHTQRTFV